MKKIFKPACLLFNILALLSFFVLGLLFAGWIEAGKGQMLAGGAIVLGYGVLFGGIALVASFFFTYHAKHRFIVVGNVVLAAFLLVSFGYFRYRFKQREKAKQEQEQPKKPTVPAENLRLLALNHPEQPNPVQLKKSMNLGFFAPNFHENPVLHFYGHPNFQKSIQDHTPIDSIVFGRFEPGGLEITQAPPWLAPEHMKLDYDLLYFSVKSLGKEFIEVIVNEKTLQTAYVNRYKGKTIYWAEFLLGVHSIEFSAPSNQKVKTKPLGNSSDIIIPFSFMQPILIREDWMKVNLWNDSFDQVGEGWIQWQKEGQLLVNYNILS